MMTIELINYYIHSTLVPYMDIIDFLYIKKKKNKYAHTCLTMLLL